MKVANTLSTPGGFCRKQGNKVSNYVVQGCDWVKNKLQKQDDGRKIMAVERSPRFELKLSESDYDVYV